MNNNGNLASNKTHIRNFLWSKMWMNKKDWVKSCLYEHISFMFHIWRGMAWHGVACGLIWLRGKEHYFVQLFNIKPHSFQCFESNAKTQNRQMYAKVYPDTQTHTHNCKLQLIDSCKKKKSWVLWPTNHFGKLNAFNKYVFCFDRKCKAGVSFFACARDKIMWLISLFVCVFARGFHTKLR